MLQEDSQWYKDAVIYQLHVRTFCDSNGDGIGDFVGLTQRLDYLQELGIDGDMAHAVLSIAATRRWVRHRRLHHGAPELRHAGRFQSVSDRGAQSRAAGDHRNGDEPHLRPAPMVPGSAKFARQSQARLVCVERH